MIHARQWFESSHDFEAWQEATERSQVMLCKLVAIGCGGVAVAGLVEGGSKGVLTALGGAGGAFVFDRLSRRDTSYTVDPEPYLVPPETLIDQMDSEK